MTQRLLLLAHLLGAVAWLGGMFFAHVCLRPAAAQVLQPPQRLQLMAAALTRFLRVAGVSVLLVLGSGLAMVLRAPLSAAPPGWHVMTVIGVVMAVIYAFVHARLLPELVARCAALDWPAAAQALNRIRRLVALNLVLGAIVLAAAVSAR
jgi:uncharacterized membrane protein